MLCAQLTGKRMCIEHVLHTYQIGVVQHAWLDGAHNLWVVLRCNTADKYNKMWFAVRNWHHLALSLNHLEGPIKAEPVEVSLTSQPARLGCVATFVPRGVTLASIMSGDHSSLSEACNNISDPRLREQLQTYLQEHGDQGEDELAEEVEYEDQDIQVESTADDLRSLHYLAASGLGAEIDQAEFERFTKKGLSAEAIDAVKTFTTMVACSMWRKNSRQALPGARAAAPVRTTARQATAPTRPPQQQRKRLQPRAPSKSLIDYHRGGGADQRQP